MPPPRRSPYSLDSQTLDIAAWDRSPAKIEIPKDYTSAPAQRVLLLDDREDFRDVIREFLVSRFYQVTGVSNGVEGLREIMKDTFDLIVCDMMMPQVGGEMFYWAVTRVRPAAGLRFIFFTGHQNDPKIQSFFKRVNATVLTKPFHLEALNSAILDVLNKLR